MAYYNSPRWSAEILDCSMPMTFDTYSKCSYKCLYCFSQYQKGIGIAKNNYLGTEVYSVSVDKIKRMFLEPDKFGGQFAQYIKERKVMQYGGLADQFDENERKMGVTLELLKFFKKIKYPLCFSTKAAWWTEDDRYMALFYDSPFWNTKISIITLSKEKARKIEVLCPSPDDRLLAIKRLAALKNNGGVTLRLRPFILGVSSLDCLELIKKAKENGANALSTEFFCFEQRSMSLRKKVAAILDKIVGYDVFEFYKKHSETNGYMRLSRRIKEKYINSMELCCKDLGMSFYVSDAHFKERCNNGSCCGLDPSFNYSRGTFLEALLLAKKSGRVYFSDIAEKMGFLKKFPWGKAEGFNTCTTASRVKFRNFSMYDYIRYIWNSPNNGKSPYKYFGGVLVPEKDLDCHGDIVYVYNSKWDMKHD